MQTFIFVHDQNIVLDFIKVNKFSSFEDVTYVFLGSKPINQIEGLDNVIICRNLEHNIEEFPNLTSFTGWYALWKNDLIKSDFINLFEYDVNCSSNLEQKIKNSLQEGNDVVGYIPLEVNHFNFIGNLVWIAELIQSLKNVYNIDLYKFIRSLNPSKLISVTSNHSMTKETLNKYMNWILPMLDKIKTSYYSGHEVERSISTFYLLQNLKYKILQGEIEHFQFNSHGTQTISANKFNNNYKKLL